LLEFFPNNRFLAWVYLLVHHAYCKNAAKMILYACLSSKAGSSVVEVWYQWFRNFLCRLEVAATELRRVFRQKV